MVNSTKPSRVCSEEFKAPGASQVVLVVKNPPVNAGEVRRGFDPWVGKIP